MISLNFVGCMAEAYPDEQFEHYVISPSFKSIKNDFHAFVKEKAATNMTMAFWIFYLEVEQILFLFIRATRENNWEFHLSACYHATLVFRYRLCQLCEIRLYLLAGDDHYKFNTPRYICYIVVQMINVVKVVMITVLFKRVTSGNSRW